MEGLLQQRGPPAETHYVSRHFEIAGGKSLRCVFNGETRLARASQSGALLFYHHDLVASVDALSDASGNLAQSNAFLPFGGIRASYFPGPIKEAMVPDYLFAQKERDRETGLLYIEARYLNPSLGRFTRVDPAIISFPPGALESPQLLNGYAFAANNPFKYGDNSGKFPQALLGIIFAAELTWDVYSLKESWKAYIENPSLSNFAALTYDMAALSKPGLLGGAGPITKAIRGVKAVKASDKLVSSLKFHKHAEIQLVKRNIDRQKVYEAIRSGKPYWDPVNKSTVFFLKIPKVKGSETNFIAAVVNFERKEIITVMKAPKIQKKMIPIKIFR